MNAPQQKSWPIGKMICHAIHTLTVFIPPLDPIRICHLPFECMFVVEKLFGIFLLLVLSLSPLYLCSFRNFVGPLPPFAIRVSNGSLSKCDVSGNSHRLYKSLFAWISLLRATRMLLGTTGLEVCSVIKLELIDFFNLGKDRLPAEFCFFICFRLSAFLNWFKRSLASDRSGFNSNAFS